MPDIDVIRSAYSLPLQWKPGGKYDYSNLGYPVLAEVITRVSGTSWDELMTPIWPSGRPRWMATACVSSASKAEMWTRVVLNDGTISAASTHL